MYTADQKDRIDQDVAHRRLLSAVVGLAIRDACLVNGRHLGENTRTGLSFLFENSDGYLELLDINPKQFRERLLALAFAGPNSSKKFIAVSLSQDDRDRFARNYRRWWDEKSSVYSRVRDRDEQCD